MKQWQWGLPVITSKTGANPDMLESKGGILVDYKNLEDIFNALDLLKNSTLRKEMSTWNVNKVERNYTVEIVMKKIVAVYKELLI